VLLLQGKVDAVQEALGTLGCLPLAERGLRIGQPQRVALAIGLFGLASASAAMVMTGFLTLREAYSSIDWPVILLLGAMIPEGMALERTGGAELIANALLVATDQMAPLVTLTVLLIGTMFLSDLVNNAAAAVLMALIAISVAQGLGVSADPLLIGVAIGSSAAFLTPIGHQSNTIVMGPGGYKFGDYWRMGLPLEVVIAVVAIPLIAWVWPF
jgi:di/tricarboxylate transporter